MQPWGRGGVLVAFVTDTNRPQPLRHPPPTACLTASGATSEAPSLLMQPCLLSPLPLDLSPRPEAHRGSSCPSCAAALGRIGWWACPRAPRRSASRWGCESRRRTASTPASCGGTGVAFWTRKNDGAGRPEPTPALPPAIAKAHANINKARCGAPLGIARARAQGGGAVASAVTRALPSTKRQAKTECRHTTGHTHDDHTALAPVLRAAAAWPLPCLPLRCTRDQRGMPGPPMRC